MAIVNILRPSDDNTFDNMINELLSYIREYNNTMLRVTKTANADIESAAEYAFGFDIMIAIHKSEVSSVSYYLKDNDTSPFDGIESFKIDLDNPNTLVKLIMNLTDADDTSSLLEVIKVLIGDILADPYRNEIYRWIRDDIGSWSAVPISDTINHIRSVYNLYGFDNEPYLRYASCSFKTSVCSILGRKEKQWYLFSKNGYSESPGFHKVDNVSKAIYVQEDFRLGEGWIIIDGKWHLFNNAHFSEAITMIDGVLYDLKGFGMLDEDPSLFELDANDKYILHRKEV